MALDVAVMTADVSGELEIASGSVMLTGRLGTPIPGMGNVKPPVGVNTKVSRSGLLSFNFQVHSAVFIGV